MLESTIIQIHRDRVKAGCEAAFRDVEERAARICAELGCPHPHLAIESLASSNDVWWLNGFDSEAQRQHVTEAYVANGPLMAAFQDIGTLRNDLLERDDDVFARYKRELSRGAPWSIRRARFLIVTVTVMEDLPEGAAFETADGTRFVFRPEANQEHATALCRAAGPDATVFTVRPYWGMPATEWIAADPEFWKLNPTVTLR